MLWLEKNTRLSFFHARFASKKSFPKTQQQKGLLITGCDYILQGGTDKTVGALSQHVSQHHRSDKCKTPTFSGDKRSINMMERVRLREQSVI